MSHTLADKNAGVIDIRCEHLCVGWYSKHRDASC
jgi:hypothetical protein